MKKIILLLTLSSVFILSCQAQKSQERKIGAFTKIEISGSVNVFYSQSDSLKLTVSAASDELDRVITEIKNESLYISNKGRFYSPVNIYVSGNNLKQLLAGGATLFKSQNTIKCDSLYMEVAGSSNINMSIETAKMVVNQNGASDINLKGKCNNLQTIIAGASTFKSYALEVEYADVQTTGASTAKVKVNNKIKANASGASMIKIKGDVKEIFAEASSAATIKRVEKPEENNAVNDTTTFNWGKKKLIIIGDENDNESTVIKKTNVNARHWKGLAFGINGYLTPSGGTNLGKSANYLDLKYSKSYNTQLNIFERQFTIHKNYIKLVTGFGIDFHAYELAKKTNLMPNSIFTNGIIDTSNTYTYKKNALKATYLQVPLLLEFNSSVKASKSFHVALGVVGEFSVFSTAKQKLEQNSYKISKIRNDDFNLSPFVAKAHLNFGYGNWTIYTEYNLTPLFERGKGPELFPFNVGLRIIPFS